MISIEIASTVRELIAYTLAYIPLTSFNGYFKAWLSYKLGDDTAKRYGYMTLNPVVHVDLIGMIMLLLVRIGFGRQVPFDLTNIKGRWHSLKTALILESNFISNFIALIVATGLLVLGNWVAMSTVGVCHATVISFMHIVQAMMVLSVSLGVIGLIFGFFSYLSTWWTPAEHFVQEHNDFIMVLLAMGLTLLAGDYIAKFIFYLAFGVLAGVTSICQSMLALVH